MNILLNQEVPDTIGRPVILWMEYFLPVRSWWPDTICTGHTIYSWFSHDCTCVTGMTGMFDERYTYMHLTSHNPFLTSQGIKYCVTMGKHCKNKPINFLWVVEKRWNYIWSLQLVIYCISTFKFFIYNFISTI